MSEPFAFSLAVPALAALTMGCMAAPEPKVSTDSGRSRSTTLTAKASTIAAAPTPALPASSAPPSKPPNEEVPDPSADRTPVDERKTDGDKSTGRQPEVVAAVGADTLGRTRDAGGERRKSEHRGSWQAPPLQQWRSAIESYVTSVRPGNQAPLNAAASAFATYINSMHNRIHPIFADGFLESLDGLPRGHLLSDMKLYARLEIILTKEGRLQKMGVLRGSGVTAFDVAALDSVNRAQPFGPAPSAIVSPDGNIYVHWEFHRDEVYACSTMNARPFLLKVPPVSPP